MLVGATPVRAQNLVYNGDFEVPGDGWTGTDGTWVGDDPHGGSYCLLMDDAFADRDPWMSSPNPIAVSPQPLGVIPIVPGTVYRFSIWARGESDGQRAFATLNQFTSSPTHISGRNIEFYFTVGREWTRFSVQVRNFSTGPGADAAFVAVYLFGVPWTESRTGTGRTWFDDVVFEPDPDPSPVYGRWLTPDPAAGMRAWIAPVEHKVRREDRPSTSAGDVDAVRLQAARGEVEPAQLVLAPAANDSLVGATFEDLAGPGGAVVPAVALSLREVAYVAVTVPTDFGGRIGQTPDPLPPFEPPLALTAGIAQPLWITLRVPTDAAPGEYRGVLRLELALGEAATVPLSLRVWDFDLPREHHLRTSYGLSQRELDVFHKLGGVAADVREVFRLYLRDFADHRVSALNATGSDGPVLVFPLLNWPYEDVVPDPTDPLGGNRVLRATDEPDAGAAAVETQTGAVIDPSQAYRIAWRARTDAGAPYGVSLSPFDASGLRIAGHNLVLDRTGTGAWQSESAEVPADQFPPETTTVRMAMWARPWDSPVEAAGTTWFDDLSLRSTAGGSELLLNGDLQTDRTAVEGGADFGRFDVAATFALDELGMDAFQVRLPNFASGANGSWTIPPPLLGYEWDTPEFDRVYEGFLRAVEEHLAARGWLDKAYVYWSDEPIEAHYAATCRGMALVARGAPRLHRLLTEGFVDVLEGCVDIWVPLVSRHDPTWARARQALGEEVWWYVCNVPHTPFPTNFIDHPGIAHRMRYWMAWKYGVQGDLYWQTNYWTTATGHDPWVDPMCDWSSGTAVTRFGNGEGRLLYPPRDWQTDGPHVEGPVPSQRWELLREGLEDYEYLWLLNDLAARLAARGGADALVDAARSLLELPPELVTSPSQYAHDPYALADYRTRVAALLEELLRELGATGGEDDGLDGGTEDGVGEGGADAEDGGEGDDDGDGGTDAAAQGPNDHGCGCGVAGDGASAACVLSWFWALFAGRRRRASVGRAAGQRP